jgi:ABC-type multidrug transport system fused ATPase/permease subunit
LDFGFTILDFGFTILDLRLTIIREEGEESRISFKKTTGIVFPTGRGYQTKINLLLRAYMDEHRGR